jgi:protein-disulfide isomerase
MPPPVRSKGVGGVRPRQASPRALAIAGGVVLVAVIAIVLGVTLGSSGGNSGPPVSDLPKVGNANSATALPGAQEANALFKGIPQKGLVLGKPSAPVEMEMFIDVQCPICQDYEVNNLPTIVQKYIRTGKVQLHLQPWAFLGGQGSQSFSGRLGLIAASFQNKGFEYAKVLYDNQGQEESGWLTDQMMGQIAASVNGLKVQQVLSQKDDAATKTIAAKVDQLAKAAKITGTPSILIGPTGGKLQELSPGNEPSLQLTEQALDAALANT